MIQRLALLIILCLPFSLAAYAEGEISVKAQLDKAAITIGDPVQYEVTITKDPDVQVLTNIPAPASDIFRVKKIDDLKSTADGKDVVGKRFTLTAFRLGNFVIDPISIQYRAGGGDIETIETQKIYLKVKSIAEGEEKEDIRGIKSVLSLAKKFLLWILILLGIFLLIAGFLTYKKFFAPKEDAKPKEVLTPEQEAMLQLNKLFDSDLLRKDKHKEYYLLLSEILRTYLEKRYSVSLIEATTFEIEKILRKQTIPADLQKKIVQVLESADLAKFAKWKPQPTEILSLNKRSKEIVEESTPVRKVEEEEESIHGA